MRLLEDGGGTIEPVLKEARIDPEIFQNPEQFLSFLQAGLFIDRAARREGVEDLGLRTGAATRITSLGLFGEVMGNALTLKDLIRQMIRWVPVANTGARVTCEEVNEESVELRMHYKIEAGRLQVDMYSLMLLIDGVRTVLGPEWRPDEVALDGAARRPVLRHEALSEASINSEVDYVGVRIPRSALSLPLRFRDRNGRPDAEGLLQSTAPPSDFVGGVAIALEGMLSQGSPPIEMAAEMAGVGVRTLQRRLTDGGTSYGKLLDRIRFEKAIEWMDNSETKLAEVAWRLGFSDPANFSRAFRRWTGVSPREFRLLRIQSRE